MKFLHYIFVLGICTDAVESYVTGSSPVGRAPWLKNNAVINESSSSTKSSFVQQPANVDVDDIFREEYNEWASRHGKSTTDPRRFETFKKNFMLQMQHNKKTGTFRRLNEFGDMTENEFERGEYETERSNGKSESSDNVVEVELVVEDPSPRVRALDSGTIPRVSNFEIPHNRQRPARVQTNHRDHYQQQLGRQHAPLDYKPKVYATRYPAIAEPTPRKRRAVRMQVGPDRIL